MTKKDECLYEGFFPNPIDGKIWCAKTGKHLDPSECGPALCPHFKGRRPAAQPPAPLLDLM